MDRIGTSLICVHTYVCVYIFICFFSWATRCENATVVVDLWPVCHLEVCICFLCIKWKYFSPFCIALQLLSHSSHSPSCLLSCLGTWVTDSSWLCSHSGWCFTRTTAHWKTQEMRWWRKACDLQTNMYDLKTFPLQASKRPKVLFYLIFWVKVILGFIPCCNSFPHVCAILLTFQKVPPFWFSGCITIV